MKLKLKAQHRANRRETNTLHQKINLATEEKACLGLGPKVEINE